MSRKSSVEKCVVDKLKKKPRLRVAAKYLANTGEVEAFVAGVAACATNVFGRPITAREVEKCISGTKEEDGYYGGAAIVLEGLADSYVVTAVEQEGLPTIYPATRKVSVNMLVRAAHTDSIVCPRVTKIVIPPLFEEAETALAAWDVERTPVTSEWSRCTRTFAGMRKFGALKANTSFRCIKEFVVCLSVPLTKATVMRADDGFGHPAERRTNERVVEEGFSRSVSVTAHCEN
jgi:hypothetical protein